MTNEHGSLRLLAGPPPARGAEPIRDHVDRLGPLSRAMCGGDLIAAIDASGLLGRGGAGFPVGRKWRSLADRAAGRAVVVANGAEGEPWSAKDRVLMAFRPHLVLDGALLAAEAIGADEIVVYVGEEHTAARSSMADALAARPDLLGRRVRLVTAPIGYVSGEASAAVNRINTGGPPRHHRDRRRPESAAARRSSRTSRASRTPR
jgi:NADH:ubiquinone oxidoreductase subunit F (NADH-binding)